MRVLHWFRKDLRLEDNTALHEAARDAAGDVVPFYASEPALLGRDDMAATRVRFVLDSLADLAARIEAAGSRLALAHGEAAAVVVAAARAARADAVYWNDEYEPALRRRDDAVEAALRETGIRVRRFHDRLLVPPGEVMTADGGPFTVYTPFRRACEALPLSRPLPEVTRLAAHDLPAPPLATLARLGFEEPASARWPGGAAEARARLTRLLAGGLARYATHRDFPAADAVSRLSADLKFGTLSPRTVADAALTARAAGAAPAAAVEKFVSELRWRDFYAHVLWHFPHVETGCFRREFDDLRWEGDPAQFEAWAAGRTGYPFVDAAMRELHATGFMHNRARMVVASFLTKDLLLDWRRGERHFMRHLVDGDLASNNGGWQWAAGTGTDSQPYFRIFNPVLQGEKFDPDGAYVRRFVPELARVPARWIHRPWEAPPLALAEAGVTLGDTYPAPIVDHAEQRARALAMYRVDAAAPPARGRGRW
uniref:Deoxyribodipyrimidine photo-lyase n=1 Tax=Eiseniibacteriota bacterium TaxID=2212470 RepID=A0A832I1E8_UNCEI